MRQRSGSHLSPRRESSVARLAEASRFDTLKRRSVVDVGDKPFPFALLPKAAKTRLARHMDLIDLSRVRAVSAWHKEFADRYLPSVSARATEAVYSVLTTMRAHCAVLGRSARALVPAVGNDDPSAPTSGS